MDKTDKNKNINVINNLNKNYKQFTFDFVSRRRTFAIIVAAIFVIGMVSFFVRGFNWDIDFLGGTIMEYNIGKDLDSSDIAEIEELVKGIIGADMVSSVVRSGIPAQQVTIKTKYIDIDEDAKDTGADADAGEAKDTSVTSAIFKALQEKYPEQNLTKDDSYIYNVNPTVGDALTRNTIFSVVLAAVLMLLYITFRFNFWSGLAAVLCLIFDMYVMLTFYSIFQIPMNTAVIAAFLTILGYSINATIIIFDRVRENLSLKKGAGMKFPEIINLSVCQTMGRSVNTTITTLVTITCVFIIGVPSIRNFVMPLIVGISSGLFSSVCISGPLWDLFRRDGADNKEKAK